MKMCQIVIQQCEGYIQHKPEVVDYCEPFCDFLHQILKVYAPKRKFEEIATIADHWFHCGTLKLYEGH